MSVNRVQWIWDNVSGMPEDVSVNTFTVINSLIKNAAEADAFVASLVTFYEQVRPYLSPVLTGTSTVKFYDLADVKPRLPWRVVTTADISIGGTALPSEVAYCASFKAAAVSGENQARRRGRVYLGPLAVSAIGAGVLGDRPNNGFRDAVSVAMQGLLDDSGNAGWQWAIWSTMDSEAYPVTAAWHDNAWDTQRRRGPDATARVNLLPA
jgi:hypothetical protein